MTDYIRGKRAYTKWNVETENVDLDLPAESPQPQVVHAHCSSGTRKTIFKIILCIFFFVMGLLFGCYVVRPSSHELANHWTPFQLESRTEDPYREFLRTIDAYSIQEHVRAFSSGPHVAGSKEAKEIAEEISSLWKAYALPNVRTETFSVLLSVPSNSDVNRAQLVDPAGNHSFSTSSGNLPSSNPYLAFSPQGTAQGKIVYANYGRQEDFDYLLEQNVTVSGNLVIMRNGLLHKGNKVENAIYHQASGVLLYSDPINVVPKDSLLSPHGAGLPGDAIVSGNLKKIPGDPQTPWLPSVEGIFREAVEKLRLPTIPVLPITYDDAEIFLRGLGGPVAPDHWQGGLDLVYSLGPGYSSPNDSLLINISVHNDLVEKNIFNVLATIPGSLEPDRYVIVGCHHDSWTNGSSDPMSGLAILMELARAFGILLKNDWRPQRTLIFATWDAEEFGIVGSTEWIQLHASELFHRTVAYINLDAAMTGNYSLMVSASPLLRHAIEEAILVVICFESSCHEGYQEIFAVWKGAKGSHPSDSPHKQFHRQPSMNILGSGSDFVTFMSGYGITSAHLQFVDRNWDSDYPLYHTKYDVFEMLSHFVDHEFTSSRTLAQIVGIILMKLSDNLVLPMMASDYGDSLQREFDLFAQTYRHQLQLQDISLDFMENAVLSLKTECHEFDSTEISDSSSKSFLLQLRQHNDRFLEMERSMLLPSGSNPETVFRHCIYGPNIHNVYQGLSFPHLRQSIVNALNQNNSEPWVDVRRQLSFVIQALWSAQEVLKTGRILEDNPSYI